MACHNSQKEGIEMTKNELIKRVLKNPERVNPATIKLYCNGGFGSGEGILAYSSENNKWEFMPNSRTGRSFYVNDGFVMEVINRHWRKLLPLYR